MRRVILVMGLVAALTAASMLPRRVMSNLKGQFKFPHYMQCDPRWGSNQMGTPGNGERSTICGEGCAMTSTSMALAGLGVMSPTNASNLVDPASFNTWLINNGGYLCAGGDCNNLNLTAPERFSPRMSLIGEDQKPSYEWITRTIMDQSIIHVAHVRDKTHFVLLTWPGPDHTFFVNDPYYPVNAYPYANISDIIAFHVDQYPVYKQCDAKWANVKMGTNNDTICQVGCLMSSISMALAGHNIEVDHQTATPETVDRFLQNNNGFVPGSSSLYESVIPKIAPGRIVWPADGMHGTNDISFVNITKMLDIGQPKVVIANVMHGEHFVLVVGYRADGDTLVVNDPGFDRNTYSYSNDVVGWRIFEMKY